MIDLGWKDVIDIVLVAIFMYYLYKLMKESSSASIFTGVLAFIVAWILVSQVFEMRLLGGIFDTLVNVGSLALIVLFQEEIRSFFSSIGRQHNSRFFRIFHRSDKDEQMHRPDIMPIVIERDTPLKEVIESGEPIDAIISQRLIENIFFKNSPLHDGAMVISKKRICAAGCILPVAHDNDIPKALGLRHRAGLGISQKSDCLAIIVSEETGGISIAQNGSFTLRLSAEELESRLSDALEES